MPFSVCYNQSNWNKNIFSRTKLRVALIMRLNKICHDFYNDGKPWQERNLNKTHMKKKKKRTGYVNHVSLSIWMWVIFVIYEIKSKMKNEFFFFFFVFQLDFVNGKWFRFSDVQIWTHTERARPHLKMNSQKAESNNKKFVFRRKITMWSRSLNARENGGRSRQSIYVRLLVFPQTNRQ